jgi:transcriptional regulator with XRE-family HTH domain
MIDIHRFGQSIKELRDRLGVSQETLSKLSGVSRQTISKIENGRTRDVSLSTVCAIDLAFYQIEGTPGGLSDNIAPSINPIGRPRR